MAYFVRKIARAKWTVLDSQSSDIIENYKADAIANDMRTTDNSLSFWKADTLEDNDIEPVIVINSLMSDNIKNKIDLLCIPDSEISDYSLENTEGDTIVSDYRKLHYNITSLTIKKLVEFADLVKALLDRSNSTPGFVIRVSPQQQKELIVKWIRNGKISYDKLKDGQKTSIDPLLNKH